VLCLRRTLWQEEQGNGTNMARCGVRQ